MRKPRLIIFIYVFCCGFSAFSQNDSIINSLKEKLKNEKNDSVSAKLNSLIGAQYAKDIKKIAIAKEYFEKAIKFGEKSNNQFKRVLYKEQLIRVIYLNTLDYSTGHRLALELANSTKGISDLRVKFLIANLLSITYKNINKRTLALAYSDSVLKFAKMINKPLYLKKAYFQNGWVLEQGLECIESYKKGLEYALVDNDNDDISRFVNNISSGYATINEGDSCIRYAKLDYFYSEKAGRIEGIAASLLYESRGYFIKKNYSETIKLAKKSMDLFNKAGIFRRQDVCAEIIYESNKKSGNAQEALKYHELFMTLRDSTNKQINITDAVAQEQRIILRGIHLKDSVSQANEYKMQETKFQHDLLIKEESIKRNRLIIIFSIIIIVLALLTGLFLYFGLRKEKKLTLQLAKANFELELGNTKIREQNAYISHQNQEIIDSITYARRLQEAILPPEKSIKEHLANSFILYLPKAIVAGDFYWFEKIGETAFIAAADCTGHDVPGAMVSVVCSNALNRAVLEFNLSDPGKILDKTRELVLETFSRSGENVKDGMDISLAKIEVIKESKKLHPGKIIIPKGQSFSDVAESMVRYKIEWAGANNRLLYFKDGNRFEITADKQPIGKTVKPSPFTTHTIELGKNDSLYLLTDGYSDQFGGPKGKKFKYKNLEDLIANNQKEKSEKQKEILLTAFQNWKGNLEQIDDVTIIGISI